MAIRSGSSGPLVALAVFVILTVLSLSTAVAFYIEKGKQTEAAQKSAAALTAVVESSFLNDGAGAELKEKAAGEKMTLVAMLLAKQEEILVVACGETVGDASTVRDALDLGENENAKQALDEARGKAAAAAAKAVEQENIAKQSAEQLASALEEAQTKEDATLKEIAELEDSIGAYRDSSQRAQSEYTQLREEVVQAREAAAADFANQLAEEQEKQASLVASNQGLTARIAVLQKQLEGFRISPGDPSLLVDGKVVDLSTVKDQVYISLGSKDRVRPGMTFEVYSDASEILFDPKTETQTPGIASVEIIKVGDSTSTARVTRKKTGKTVKPGNVLANAVYSPTYQYKFMVFGKFDVDSDGKVTDGEADYIRAKIKEWGGLIVDGDELRPDVDFVVVGAVPPRPQAGSAMGEDDAAYAASLAAIRAYDSYQTFIRASNAAQVPVLNWNRFQILTGSPER
ncbi:MAG: hypothetical protein EXS15_03830 [Phycisphaerales bacterium]|nr:hypothetical protein [Phycisphaerales bacterium]